MFGFLKKLFGVDVEEIPPLQQKDCPQAPYKIETPVEKIEIKEVAPVVVETKDVSAANKKPRGPKKPQGQKPTTTDVTTKPQQPSRRGRKPKAKS